MTVIIVAKVQTEKERSQLIVSLWFINKILQILLWGSNSPITINVSTY